MVVGNTRRCKCRIMLHGEGIPEPEKNISILIF